MTESKHTWTEQELWVVCVCYKEGLPIDLALRLTNTKNQKSMEMRYRNCLYLDKGRVENALSHTSKTHKKVWEEVEQLYNGLEEKYITDTLCVCQLTLFMFIIMALGLLFMQLKTNL